MLYFSEIKEKQVITDKNVILGKLDDVIFLAAETPLITKMVIRKRDNELMIIPMEYLLKFNNCITMASNYKPSELIENELYIRKNLLDKQIIDVAGNKVIRVNDVVIQDKNETTFYIAGVDIGIRGILRRLKLKKYALPIYRFFRSQTHPHYLCWTDIQPLELAKGNVQLKKERTHLEKMRAEDLADYLEKINIKNANHIIEMLDEKQAASVLGELNVNFQSAIFSHFPPDKAAKLLSFVDTDEATDLLLSQNETRRENILLLLPDNKRSELEHLLSLSYSPIGKLITTGYLTVQSSETVGQVLKQIKEKTMNFPSLNYVYVINPENHLVGVFTVHELLIQNADEVVHNFMIQNVVVVHLTTPKELVIKKMIKYKLFALPVIDQQKKILGIITFDDIAETLLKYL